SEVLGWGAAHLPSEGATEGRHGGVSELAGEVLDVGLGLLELPHRALHAQLPQEAARWCSREASDSRSNPGRRALNLCRECPDRRQGRFRPSVYESRTKHGVGQGSEPPRSFPDACAQLAPEPLDDENLEQADHDRRHAKAWMQELGIQGVKKG